MDKELKIKRDIELVVGVVCDFFNVEVDSIYKRDRTSKATTARGYAIYILHNDYGVSISRLSFEFKRIPRAIFWHCSKVKNFINCYPDYKEKYESICKMLK